MNTVSRVARVVLPILAAVAALPPTAGAQESGRAVHEIRLVQEDELFRFVPAEVVARPGDVLEFVVESGAPHNVVFDGREMSPTERRAWNAAMPRRAADLTSPLFVDEGTEYRVVVPVVPGGVYRFYSLPKLAYDMAGTVTVVRDGED